MGGHSDDPREKLLGSNEVLQDTGETLDRTLKVGLSSEQMANDTLNDLKRQRGQIIGINEKVNDVGTNVNSANRLITRMDRRRIWMKLMMLVTIFLLLIANAVVLYIKLK
jgi:cell division protein FtsX